MPKEPTNKLYTFLVGSFKCKKMSIWWNLNGTILKASVHLIHFNAIFIRFHARPLTSFRHLVSNRLHPPISPCPVEKTPLESRCLCAATTSKIVSRRRARPIRSPSLFRRTWPLDRTWPNIELPGWFADWPPTLNRRRFFPVSWAPVRNTICTILFLHASPMQPSKQF